MPHGMSLLGAVCEGGSREAGELTFTFTADGRFTNAVGFLCGGYIAQMLDQAATYASSFVTGKASPSLDLTVRFIAPARPGTFTAVGSVIKAGNAVAFLEAKLFDSSRALVATGAVTAHLLSMATLAQKGAAGPKPPAPAPT
jgi:uncharacterized protein (TIGR00369 family)